MRLMRAKRLSFKKFGEGFYDVDGLWVDGVEEVVQVRGSLQPTSEGTARELLPEGVNSSDSKVFYTEDEILTVNHLTNTQAYETSIGGLDYVVVNSSPWTGTGLSIDHFKVMLVRKDKHTGSAT